MFVFLNNIYNHIFEIFLQWGLLGGIWIPMDFDHFKHLIEYCGVVFFWWNQKINNNMICELNRLWGACTILLLGISSALSGYKIWLKMTSLFTMVALLLCSQWSHILHEVALFFFVHFSMYVRGFRWFLDIKVSRYCEGYSFL